LLLSLAGSNGEQCHLLASIIRPSILFRTVCRPCGASQIAAADPVTYASSASPPMLIVHGTADGGGSITQSQYMARQLAALNVPVETYYVPDIDHGIVGTTAPDDFGQHLRGASLPGRR